MVAGLVSVDIAAQEAFLGDVFIVCVAVFRQVGAEEVVQGGDEAFVTAHQLQETIHILRGVEGEILRIALDKALSYSLFNVEIGLESSIVVTGACQGDGRVEDVPVIGCPLIIAGGGFLVSQTLCRGGDGPVIVGILQGVAGGRGAGFQRHVAQFHVFSQSAVPGNGGGGDHSLQGLFSVHFQALGDGV